MAKLASPLEFNSNEARNMRLHNLGSAPSSPLEGQVYQNTTDHKPYYHNGTSFFSFTDALTLGGQSSAYHLARANHTGTQVAATISDFDAAVRTSRLDQMAVPTGPVSMGSQKITNQAAGTSPADGVNFAQLEAARQGIRTKAAVDAAMTTNVVIANPGTAVFDGQTLAVGERILLGGQTTATEIGIYVFNGSGVAMTRADDADVFAELDSGTEVFAQGGTANGGKIWRQLTELTSFSGQVWSPVSTGVTYVAGAGMTESPAGTFNVVGNAGRIVANADDIDLATGVCTPGTYKSLTVDTYGRATAGTNPTTLAGFGITDAVKRYTALIGDGSTLTFTIAQATHLLAAARTNLVQVLEDATGIVVLPDITLSSNGDVVIAFSVAPTSNQYRVVIMG